jgi:hypothetical protein
MTYLALMILLLLSGTSIASPLPLNECEKAQVCPAAVLLDRPSTRQKDIAVKEMCLRLIPVGLQDLENGEQLNKLSILPLQLHATISWDIERPNDQPPKHVVADVNWEGTGSMWQDLYFFSFSYTQSQPGRHGRHRTRLILAMFVGSRGLSLVGRKKMRGGFPIGMRRLSLMVRR